MSHSLAEATPGITRIGVDVGGTFTDLILYDGRTGQVRLAKEPTTPSAPERGVIDATRSAVSADALQSADYFLHGTTVGLNALLERRGASVALLTTQGFRDVLELRRGDADEPYNLFWRQPPALVARSLRIPIVERIRADGVVHTPLDEASVRAATEVLLQNQIESVAIVFMNAYAYPHHEMLAEKILRDGGYRGLLSLSHRISGEYREYERTCTTVIDAYVRPRTSTYLRNLDTDLRAANFGGSLLVTRSGGGAMTAHEAEERPFETIMSGPVAGAEGAAELSRILGLSSTITADVGGTSFDTCLITDGRPNVTYQGTVIGLPVQSAWVDVRSVGAGGGSVAYVDVGGLLRVGPRSSGAVPGPACYGRGGAEATVTDAAFFLGMLGPGELASGITLDHDAASTVLENLSAESGIPVRELAKGVITIANANMADAIRSITVEQGVDPRDSALMPFGGAGPLFATLLASELEVARIVVPPFAGNFSAWGLLGADLTQTSARTRILPLSDDSLADLRQVLAELFTELDTRMGEAPGERLYKSGLDMRYSGQEHSLTVEFEVSAGSAFTPDADVVHRAFTESYVRTFGHHMDEQVEIVSARATARTALPRLDPTSAHGAARLGAPVRAESEGFSFALDQWTSFVLVERTSLSVGSQLSGPAIVLEDTATTYLDAGYLATVDSTWALIIEKENP